MSEPAKIEDRVTKLENEIVEVRHLAAHADKEASDNTAVLRGQVGILNALRADVLKLSKDHGERIDRLDRRVGRLDRKVDDGFAQANTNFVKIEENFAGLKTGQDRITELLEARDSPEEA